MLTIGYLIVEAETVDLMTTDGRSYPATVVGYDNATGFGLLRALRPLPVPPVQIGQSATVARSRAGPDRRLRRRRAGLRGLAAPVRRLLGIPARRGDLHGAGDRQLERRGASQPRGQAARHRLARRERRDGRGEPGARQSLRSHRPPEAAAGRPPRQRQVVRAPAPVDRRQHPGGAGQRDRDPGVAREPGRRRRRSAPAT